MAKLKIGYASYSADFSHPADRRRLAYWARKRGHDLTHEINNTNDVNVLTNRADFIGLQRKSTQAPVIFDMVDGYLGPEVHWKDWGRGVFKIATNQLSGSMKPYRQLIIEACVSANAVLCETPEQKLTITPFCNNVHSILDFHEEFPWVVPTKSDLLKVESKLIWEGFPFTIKGLLLLEKTFLESDRKIGLSMEVITDLEYPKYLGEFIKRPTSNLLGQIPNLLGERLQLIEWNIPNLISAARRASIAVLPLDPRGSLNALKAENRLLIFWRLGLPVLTSPSLAYNRVMEKVGIQGICFSESDWKDKIIEFVSDPIVRFNSVTSGQEYLRETHTERLLLEAWDNLIESVL